MRFGRHYVLYVYAIVCAPEMLCAHMIANDSVQASRIQWSLEF